MKLLLKVLIYYTKQLDVNLYAIRERIIRRMFLVTIKFLSISPFKLIAVTEFTYWILINELKVVTNSNTHTTNYGLLVCLFIKECQWMLYCLHIIND